MATSMMPDPAALAADPRLIGLGDAPRVTADAYFHARSLGDKYGSTVEAEIVRCKTGDTPRDAER